MHAKPDNYVYFRVRWIIHFRRAGSQNGIALGGLQVSPIMGGGFQKDTTQKSGFRPASFLFVTYYPIFLCWVTTPPLTVWHHLWISTVERKKKQNLAWFSQGQGLTHLLTILMGLGDFLYPLCWFEIPTNWGEGRGKIPRYSHVNFLLKIQK